jgi:hypothetical protein
MRRLVLQQPQHLETGFRQSHHWKQKSARPRRLRRRLTFQRQQRHLSPHHLQPVSTIRHPVHWSAMPRLARRSHPAPPSTDVLGELRAAGCKIVSRARGLVNLTSCRLYRGLAWTPESAADVAKLQGAPTARTPVASVGANQLFESFRAVGSSRATALTDHSAPDSGTTAGSGRLPTPTFHLRDSDKENLRLNLLNRNPSSPAGWDPSLTEAVSICGAHT